MRIPEMKPRRRSLFFMASILKNNHINFKEVLI